jgi:hypothetical protein
VEKQAAAFKVDHCQAFLIVDIINGLEFKSGMTIDLNSAPVDEFHFHETSVLGLKYSPRRDGEVEIAVKCSI